MAPDTPEAKSIIAPPPAATEVPGRGWGARAVPFVPILLALTGALIARQIIGSKPGMSMNHPPAAQRDLTGTKAPQFSLRNVHKAEGEKETLSLLCDKGPVVLIFYRAYSCHRCVAALTEIAEDYPAYKNAGIEVLAICPDMPAALQSAIASNGDMPFPMLSDPDDQIAKAYGLEVDGDILHGAFIVDQKGIVRLAYQGDHPYPDSKDLLGRALAVQSGK